MQLVDKIKKTLEFVEVRPSDDPDRYFEAVLESKDLDRLVSIVKENYESLKSPGKRVKLSKNINELVDNIGGLRPEQSFYFKQEAGGEYTYVALWPWQSDNSKITLKVGKGHFPA